MPRVGVAVSVGVLLGSGVLVCVGGIGVSLGSVVAVAVGGLKVAVGGRNVAVGGGGVRVTVELAVGVIEGLEVCTAVGVEERVGVRLAVMEGSGVKVGYGDAVFCKVAVAAKVEV
jgi:hypothetical protein